MSDEKETKWAATKPLKTEDKIERLLEISRLRMDSIERVQAAQHAELQALYTGLRGLQRAFEALTEAMSPPAN